MTDWSALDAALEHHQPTLWWRDDDAIADTPALHRLMDLAESVGAPLTLAVIPGNLTDSLASAIKDRDVTTAAHGWTHSNHAPKSEKKAEFREHRSEAILMAEAERGKKILEDAFGEQSLPLFIPPWNRMAEDLPLAKCGYQGVSIFGQRQITDKNGLIRFDAHIDPIDWHGSRSALSEKSIENMLAGLLQVNVPIGLMTHHLVHDEAIWTLCSELVKRLTAKGAKWVSARDFLTRPREESALRS